MRNFRYDRRIFLGIMLIFFIGTASAAIEQNHVISNSENWEDVYSTMLFAKLNGVDGDFLTSTADGPLLLNSISTSKNVLIVSSKDKPFVLNYDSQLRDRGYAGVKEMEVKSANLELIDKMDQITNFIVVSNAYGYNAIAVTPYAIKTNSWVFLADRANIGEIQSILNRKNINNLIVYGYMDREITDALAKFNPETIDSGNRFDDNIAIVNKFLELDNTKQVLLSNGEFIEKEIMNGKHPVLFTGRDNVPKQIADYLKSSDIEVGVLIGNELINAATNIRRDTGISVMVKFAQGARSQTDGVAPVEGLDLFYVPTPIMKLSVYSVKYNKASSQIEVTYKSGSNIPIYISETVTAIYGDQTEVVPRSDNSKNLLFISPGDYKTVTYSPQGPLNSDELKAQIYALYGESSGSLDRVIQGQYPMGIINVIDRCNIEVTSVHYNKQARSFYVHVKDKSDADCYSSVELRDVKINGLEQTIGTKSPVLIKAGKKMKIEIPQRMTSDDLYDNPYIDTVVYYGERKNALVKIFMGKFDLNIDMLTGTTYLVILILVLLILVSLYLWKRKKDDEW